MNTIKFLWKKWLKIAHVIGNFQGQVIMTLFYFVILLPFGIGFRVVADPLRMKQFKGRSNFQKWSHPEDTLETAKHQF